MANEDASRLRPEPARARAESTDRPVLRVRHPLSNGELTVVVTICLIVIVAAAIAARDGEVASWERHVLVWFNDWPEELEPIFWTLQQFGLLFSPLVAGAIVAIAARRWQLFIPFAIVLPLKLLFEKTIVKSFVERERPYTSIGDEIIVRGGAYEGLSFPSGHTTTAFATAVLLLALLPPKWRWAPVVWAALVGIARMYMGEHNALDVIVGAAIGTLFAVFIWRFVLEHPWIAGNGRQPR
jgi:membrane-associated phospholipid phosphatase